MVFACHARRTREGAEAAIGSLGVSGQPGLYSKDPVFLKGLIKKERTREILHHTPDTVAGMRVPFDCAHIVVVMI